MEISKNIFKIPKKSYLELMPKIKEEKTQAFTTIVLTLISLTFFGFFAISPTLSTIAQLKKQLADNIMVDKKLAEKIKNLGILYQKYSYLEKDLPRVLAAIPQNPDAPILLGKIQTVAQKNNLAIVRLQTYEVELTKPKDNLKDYSSFSFSLEGQVSSYENLENFLTSLVNFDRIISIDLLSVNSAEKTEGLRVSMRGKAFFKK